MQIVMPLRAAFRRVASTKPHGAHARVQVRQRTWLHTALGGAVPVAALAFGDGLRPLLSRLPEAVSVLVLILAGVAGALLFRPSTLRLEGDVLVEEQPFRQPVRVDLAACLVIVVEPHTGSVQLSDGPRTTISIGPGPRTRRLRLAVGERLQALGRAPGRGQDRTSLRAVGIRPPYRRRGLMRVVEYFRALD